jgi:hypothetical protein
MPLAPALLAVSLLSPQAGIPTTSANCTGGVAGAVDLCLADRELAQAEVAQRRIRGDWSPCFAQ